MLVGVSGGAVQIGRSAGPYKVFMDGLESALDNIENLNTLGVANFEVLPHYNCWDENFKESIKEYSRTLQTNIYALNDGDGILMDNGKFELIGNVIRIENGEKSSITPSIQLYQYSSIRSCAFAEYH